MKVFGIITLIVGIIAAIGFIVSSANGANGDAAIYLVESIFLIPTGIVFSFLS